jgi:hypothetical protein
MINKKRLNLDSLCVYIELWMQKIITFEGEFQKIVQTLHLHLIVLQSQLDFSGFQFPFFVSLYVSISYWTFSVVSLSL